MSDSDSDDVFYYCTEWWDVHAANRCPNNFDTVCSCKRDTYACYTCHTCHNLADDNFNKINCTNCSRSSCYQNTPRQNFCDNCNDYYCDYCAFTPFPGFI